MYTVYGIEAEFDGDAWQTKETIFVGKCEEPYTLFDYDHELVEWVINDLSNGAEDVLQVIEKQSQEPLFILLRENREMQ